MTSFLLLIAMLFGLISAIFALLAKSGFGNPESATQAAMIFFTLACFIGGISPLADASFEGAEGGIKKASEGSNPFGRQTEKKKKR